MSESQYSNVMLDRRRLEISDVDLVTSAELLTPLYLKGDTLHQIPDSVKLRGEAFTWEVPDNPVGKLSDYRALGTTWTQHTCAYYGFFKPTLAEVYAQIPTTLLEMLNRQHSMHRPCAFYLRVETVQILQGGHGHHCECVWLAALGA